MSAGPTSRDTTSRSGAWLGAAGCAWLVALAVIASPWGSFPVGYDAFWNLLVAAKWSASGFPAAMPEAACTDLATAYGDRQLLFHGLLAAATGGQPSLEAVAPLLWLMALLHGIVLWVCLARGAGGYAATGVWLYALPAASQIWLFRSAALRDMLLAILFLVPLVALAASPPAAGRRGRSRAVGLALLAAGFCYSHGAVVLPLVLWACVATGHRLDRGRWPWRDGGALMIGTAAACVLRPDLPAYFGVLWKLNLGMPYANLRAEIGILPTEFAPLTFAQLVSVEWPFLIGAAALAWTCWRRTLPWALALPIAFAVGSALLSRRMFEIAAPMLVLGLAHAWSARLRDAHRWLLAGGSIAIVALVHLPRALDGIEQNRVLPLRDAGLWIASQIAAAGPDRAGDDLVLVTDWGATSPLAWFGRDVGLRGTGAIDPVLMWAHDRDTWSAWKAIKEGRDPSPLTTARDRFGARFVAFSAADTSPGAPLAATAKYLLDRGRAWAEAGRPLTVFVTPDPIRPMDPGNWIVFDLAP